MNITAHNVVAVVTFWDLVVRIHTDLWRKTHSISTGEEETEEGKARKPSQVFLTNLEDIVSRFHICDIDPLAVDLGVIGVVTSWTQALHVGHSPADD